MATLMLFHLAAISMSSHSQRFSRHRLFAEDGFRLASVGGYRHRCVEFVPRCNTNDVQIFFVEHLASVELACLKVVSLTEIVQCTFNRVGNRDDFDFLDALIAPCVIIGNATATDNSNAIFI